MALTIWTQIININKCVTRHIVPKINDDCPRIDAYYNIIITVTIPLQYFLSLFLLIISYIELMWCIEIIMHNDLHYKCSYKGEKWLCDGITMSPPLLKKKFLYGSVQDQNNISCTYIIIIVYTHIIFRMQNIYFSIDRDVTHISPRGHEHIVIFKIHFSSFAPRLYSRQQYSCENTIFQWIFVHVKARVCVCVYHLHTHTRLC